MAIQNPIRKFQTDGEAAMPKGKLLVALYERLLRDLDDADAAIVAHDRNASHHALVHAQEIVAALEAALDTDTWPEGRQLAEVYGWLLERLLTANLRQDRSVVSACRNVVAPLHETWAEAWRRQTAAAVAAPAPTAPAAVASPAGNFAASGASTARVPLDIAG